MITKLLSAHLLVCLFSTQGQVPLDHSNEQGQIEFAIFDSFAARLKGARIEVERLKNGAVIEAVKGKQQMTLKCGDYRFTVDQPGYSRATKEVTITPGISSVSICLFPASIGESGNQSEVKGRLLGLGANPDCRLVRLISICDGSISEASVFTGGQFLLEHVRPGYHTAVVLGQERICSMTEHKVLVGALLQEIVISIKGKGLK